MEDVIIKIFIEIERIDKQNDGRAIKCL